MSPLATMMLLLWPVLVAMLFGRMRRPEALVWSILAGYLLLPPAIGLDLPAIPSQDKSTIPAVAAAFFAFITPRSEGEGDPPPMAPLIAILLVMMLTAPILTALTNPDPLIEGVAYRPGIGMTQGIGEMITGAFRLLPFVLGYLLLSDARGTAVLLRALVAGMLCYSVLMLTEIRLSPQLNVWIYGYFQHDFSQTIRGGGFRPIVFLEHPLWVGFLCLVSLLSAMAIARAKRNRKWYGITAYLAVLLVLCKSLGVLLHFAIAAPILWFLRPRAIVGVALCLGMAVAVYPVLRAASWQPMEQVISTAHQAEAERAQSLSFRLHNEGILLERAMERPLFGWGGWARALVVSPETGRTVTITDGEWIRVLGMYGIWGYVGEFGLFLAPIFLLWRAWPRQRAQAGAEELSVVVIALIVSANMVDLIPNATVTPVTLLLSGVLAGSAIRMRQGRFFTQEGTIPVQELTKRTGLKPVL